MNFISEGVKGIHYLKITIDIILFKSEERLKQKESI